MEENKEPKALRRVKIKTLDNKITVLELEPDVLKLSFIFLVND
jgi:hypothetical protein